MNNKQVEKIKYLYQNYNLVIKPLITEVEVRSHVFPTTVFNEIRAFNDHIARCYYDEIDAERIDYELDKADSHLISIILDLHKYLIIFHGNDINRFEHQTRRLDLTKIDEGKFFVAYGMLKKKAVDKLREAKLIENKKRTDFSDVVRNYGSAYDYYTELIELIENNLGPIGEIKGNLIYAPVKKSILSTAKWIFLTVLSTILSILLTILFYDSIKEWINCI